MNKLKGAEIRQRWIKFFESKGHQYIPGVGLIPQGDKSLLWVNAGVTGLKKYFDGSEVPPCRRIVNVQKSIRTNDIENVGHTARHHTFFEMLGNFSIGDYFRNEVIPWAFEILTNPETGFGIPVEKLYMTYEPHDQATYELWQKVGMPKDHLIPLEGNFWEIGEGPSGPDTEMFFDRGEEYDPQHLGIKMLQDDIENDRYIEIWNIVFSQYNAEPGKPRSEYKELPSKNIDTGSGLERIACILQGTETNFETDLFMPIIKATEELSGKEYKAPNLMSFRVIADHARTLTFALADGAFFSNEGRGYVLRRVIRRAMRYGQKLGLTEPFMYKLVDVVVKEYSDFYPNLGDKKDIVVKMIRSEEEKFVKTLSSGEKLLREVLADHKDLSGEEAFKLYDTFGFPIELTKEIVEENGGSVDMEKFAACMEKQREIARNARGEVESFHKQSKDLLAFKTPSEFTYEEESLEAIVTGLFVNGEAVDMIDEEGDIAFDVTPFYAESGGQVSDTGVIEGEDFKANVIFVGKAPAGQHLHHVQVEFGQVKVGDKLSLKIDSLKRHLIMRNHSATHLLHAAIGNVLGEHVDQKGSFQNEDYLRFDFTSLRALTEDEKRRIENEVNEKIYSAIEEVTHVLPIEEAKKLGAEMEFSEKYGSTVRVVTFGEYSKEFCGGTHVKNSEDIGLFVLESEEAVSSGTRRIQGRTSLGAIKYLAQKRALLNEAESLFGGISDKDLIGKEKSLMTETSSLKKELASIKDQMASANAKKLADEFVEVNGVHVFAKYVKGEDRNALLRLGDNLKVVYEDYAVMLLGGEEGNAPLVVLAGGKGAKLGAGNIIKAIAPILDARGGGKPEMASGSAKAASKFDEASAKMKELF